MLDTLTADQIIEWQAYDRLDPIGSFRHDFLMALLISKITNIVNSIYCKKNQPPTLTSPLDFLPDWSGEKKVAQQKKQTPAEIRDAMMSFANSHNKVIEKAEMLKMKQDHKKEKLK